MFHHMVAQILFIWNLSRIDVQTHVDFIITWVKSPDEENWGKLKRFMNDLKRPKGMKLTLQDDSLNIIKWYVDASFDNNHECHGKISATITLSYWSVPSFSRNNKLNGKSSTEIELIGLNDDLPIMLWMYLLIMVQVYSMI